jgi:hypothetical protein
MPEPAQLHRDLVRWHILEPDPPIRFTRRFRGALARAAAQLQSSQVAGTDPPGDPLTNQVEAALAMFLGARRERATAAHHAFVRAVHLETLPGAVKRALGL